MSRKAGNEKEVVEIKIIDFQYACYFGSSLPKSFSRADYRYPLRFLKEIRETSTDLFNKVKSK